MKLSSIGARALADLLTGWTSDPGPSYRSLADRIRLLVLDGRVPTGTQLPSERELATVLGVARSTVSSAFDELRSSQHVESRRGARSTVCLPGRSGQPESTLLDTVDLACGASAAAPGMDAVIARAAARLPAFLPSAGYFAQGLPETRAAIAARYTSRGLPTDPDEILVTAGAQGAIALVARALLSRGDRVMVETPGYQNAFAALRAAGARLLATPVDFETGWDPALPETIRRQRPDAAYLIPDFQNPTGHSMPDSERSRLVRAAADAATTLIIDEATSDLDIDRPYSTTPVAAFAQGSSGIITIGSASKAFWGGLRIGWVRASRSVIRRLLAIRPATDLGVPVFEQLALTEALTDSDAILVSRRPRDRVQRDTLVQALRATFPDWDIPVTHGGIALWVRLPAPVSSRLASAARQHGVIVPAGPVFSIDGSFERFLRIPFMASAADLQEAVLRLSHAWKEIGGQPVVPTTTEPYATVV